MGLTFQNRGLTIAWTDHSYLNEGAYGVIFADRVAGRIIELFRRFKSNLHPRLGQIVTLFHKVDWKRNRFD